MTFVADRNDHPADVDVYVWTSPMRFLEPLDQRCDFAAIVDNFLV